MRTVVRKLEGVEALPKDAGARPPERPKVDFELIPISDRYQQSLGNSCQLTLVSIFWWSCLPRSTTLRQVQGDFYPHAPIVWRIESVPLLSKRAFGGRPCFDIRFVYPVESSSTIECYLLLTVFVICAMRCRSGPCSYDLWDFNWRPFVLTSFFAMHNTWQTIRSWDNPSIRMGLRYTLPFWSLVLSLHVLRARSYSALREADSHLERCFPSSSLSAQCWNSLHERVYRMLWTTFFVYAIRTLIFQ